MLRDTKGNRLFKKVDIKIIFPENIFPVKHMVQHAPVKRAYSVENIDEILMSVTDQLDNLYPWWEFKFTELAPQGRTARYIFQFAKYRANAPTAEQIKELGERAGETARLLDANGENQSAAKAIEDFSAPVLVDGYATSEDKTDDNPAV